MLFSQLSEDLDRIMGFSESSFNDLVQRARARFDPSQPHCKTHHHFAFEKTFDADANRLMKLYMEQGFVPSRQGRVWKFPGHKYGMPDVAHLLGLPQRDDLLYAAAILINEHPEITPGFLQDLQLVDDEESRAAILHTDVGTRLIGHKPRKGESLAQQKITLTERSERVLANLIFVTEPVRSYLKRHGDIRWKFIFLSTGSGFAKPSRLQLSGAGRHAKHRSKRMAMVLNIPQQEASRLADRLSLRRVRAHTAVVEYIKSPNIDRFAKILGHTTTKHPLISRYLPPSIYEFFLNRWIRIFQESIVIHAMKDSPLRLRASPFATDKDLDAFLSKHILSLPHSEQKAMTGGTKVLIGLDVSTGRLLRDVHAQCVSTKNPTATVKYWSDFYIHVTAIVRKNRAHYAELNLVLDQVEGTPCP